ncbi:uncharacterized protein [Diadema antillarum]|uniref:uncharacterized protein n=1 Tax=Diadema antillarum TaxID=105358 RepID=UPI003A844612
METEEEINDEHERQVKEQDTKLDQVQAQTTEHQASPVELATKVVQGYCKEDKANRREGQGVYDPVCSVEQLNNFLKSMRTQYSRLTNPKSGKGTRDTPYSERDQWILNTFRVLEGHIVRMKGRTLGRTSKGQVASQPREDELNALPPTRILRLMGMMTAVRMTRPPKKLMTPSRA